MSSSDLATLRGYGEKEDQGQNFVQFNVYMLRCVQHADIRSRLVLIPLILSVFPCLISLHGLVCLSLQNISLNTHRYHYPSCLVG